MTPSTTIATPGRNSRLERLLAGFERFADASREDAERIRLIDAFLAGLASKVSGTKSTVARTQAVELRAILQRGIRTGEPEPTLASSLFMRELRLTVIGALLEAVGGDPDADLRVVTVINRQWRYKASQLDHVTPEIIKRQFRTHLERAGVLAVPGFLVAFLHGEFEPTSGRYQLHYHLLTTAEKARAMGKRLNGRWGYEKTATGAASIKRQKVKDRPRQFSYLLKSYWPEKPVVSIDGRLKRIRGHRRIKGPNHTQYLVWLHRTSLNDLIVVSQCVYRNSRFHFS